MSTDDLRRQLADLAGLQAKTDAAERQILSSAQQRLGTVNAMLKLAEPGARQGDPNAQAQYQALVLERGELSIVIAKARQALA
ncbi:hypothetical protein [Geminicoccus flavidas]|uniref:hypothetical protein n=1 Tax=Geminicoccus flavidas TaxID=2506407 RepID=UPI001357C385|nr:hypothetical protein [Geminicoccus flavidas]